MTSGDGERLAQAIRETIEALEELHELTEPETELRANLQAALDEWEAAADLPGAP